jgi:putative NIF3 family GTP cyclohydrolase 1 type 2
MKLGDMYGIAIEKGIERDPRPKAEIKKALEAAKRGFRKLKGVDKKAFDRESLRNPYADTRILYGDPGTDVRTVIIGIDMEMPELLLADRLNERGAAIDLVMAHHPEGLGWANLSNVMGMQKQILEKFGITAEIAKERMDERISEVARSLAGGNHFRSVDVARLLNMPYMCVHTPADNHVTDYLQRMFDRAKPKKLSQVIDMLKVIPEYADGLKKGAGPKILTGEPKAKAGKIMIDMTGGTEGSKKMFARLSQAGVGTIIGMHFSEDHYKSAKDERINMVVAGHIASDTLGLNLLLDQIEKKERLNMIPCSGFIRVKR